MDGSSRSTRPSIGLYWGSTINIRDVELDPAHLDLQIVPLRSETVTDHEKGFSFEAHELFDYGVLRYHLLVSYDSFTPDSIERRLLQSCHQALSTEAHWEEIEQVMKELRRWWEPVVKADYVRRCRVLQESQLAQRLPRSQMISRPDRGIGKRDVVKIRLSTGPDGKLLITRHSFHMDWPPYRPVQDLWGDVRIFGSGELEVIGRPERRLGIGVRIRGRLFHLKSLETFLDQQLFIRMVDNHRRVEGCPRFPRLAGLRASDDGTGVDGVLRPMVNGMFLDEINSREVQQGRKERWKGQISEAAKVLVSVGIGWEQAVPADIFITDSDDVLVYGFGGAAPIITTGRGNVLPPKAPRRAADLSEIWCYLA